MAAVTGAYDRGRPILPAATAVVGKRLSKRSPAGSSPAAPPTPINTSSTSLGSAGPPRPSPGSGRADGFVMSPAEVLHSPAHTNAPTSAPRHLDPALPTQAFETDRNREPGLGLKKKMSRTGNILGKRSSMRLGLGLRSQTELRPADSPEETDRVISEIREKAAIDTTRARDHAAAVHAMGPTATSNMHPIRRKSLLTPGLATRDPHDPLRKPPANGHLVRPSLPGPVDVPPASAALLRPPLSASAAYGPMVAGAAQVGSAPLERLAPLDLAADSGVNGMPRSSTPSECDYGRLGAGLRITNGIASPTPSARSGRGSYQWSLPHGSALIGDNTAVRNRPLKSRLYMIQSADNDAPASAPSTYHHQTSSSTSSDPSSQLARQYMSDLPSSPFDSSPDLARPRINKPLPSPPPSNTHAVPAPNDPRTVPHKRSISARPDLEYRRRESLDGDIGEHQENLYDETISLLESIGSSHSDSSPRVTTTTTTTTTTFSTVSSSAMPPSDTNSRDAAAKFMQRPGSKIVITGPVTSVVRTSTRSRPQPQSPSVQEETPSSQSRKPPLGSYSLERTEGSAPHKAVSTIPPDSSKDRERQVHHSYTARRSEMEHTQGQNQPREGRLEHHHRPPHLSLSPSQTVHQSQAHRTARPPLSAGTGSDQTSSFSSKFSTSSETTPTLASLRDSATAPLSPKYRRLKKSRHSSLPPVERIPVQGQKITYSGFIPPVPQDIAARHAKRSEEFPPLARTVPHVRHVKSSSFTAAAPLSAPLTVTGSRRPGSQQRGAKAFFPRRQLSITAEEKQVPEPEIHTAPSQMSRRARRASRSDTRLILKDEKGENVAWTDLDELADYYGTSPYDAASPEADYWDHPYQYRHQQNVSSAPISGGMTEAQSSQLNKMRMQYRFDHSIDEHLGPTPQSAPPSNMQFAAHREAQSYDDEYWDEAQHDTNYGNGHYDTAHQLYHELPAEQDYEDHLYGNETSSQLWLANGNPWGPSGRSHKVGSTSRRAPTRRYSDKPLPSNPDPYLELASPRRDSERSRTTLSSPTTPTDEAWIPAAGRFEGGLGYGYEPGRGVNGSAGTRPWQSEASRKGVGMVKQYGIDLTDVPIFVAPNA